MTPEQEHKQIERRLRSIPIEAIATVVAEMETGTGAIICLIDKRLEFVSPIAGERFETTWDDPLECAQIVRWLRAHSERVHQTYDSALVFVRGRK